MSAIDHIHITCCHRGCSAIITFHRQEHDRLKRTRESFGCPYGHQQHFTGKTDEEKRIDQLELLVKRLGERNQEAYDAYDHARHGAGVCPLGCGYRSSRRIHGWPPTESDICRFYDRVWEDLRTHLVREHNATIAPVALLAERTGS